MISTDRPDRVVRTPSARRARRRFLVWVAVTAGTLAIITTVPVEASASSPTTLTGGVVSTTPASSSQTVRGVPSDPLIERMVSLHP